MHAKRCVAPVEVNSDDALLGIAEAGSVVSFSHVVHCMQPDPAALRCCAEVLPLCRSSGSAVLYGETNQALPATDGVNGVARTGTVGCLPCPLSASPVSLPCQPVSLLLSCTTYLAPIPELCPVGHQVPSSCRDTPCPLHSRRACKPNAAASMVPGVPAGPRPSVLPAACMQELPEHSGLFIISRPLCCSACIHTAVPTRKAWSQHVSGCLRVSR